MDRLEAHRKLIDILKQNNHNITRTRKIVFDVLLNHEPRSFSSISQHTGSAINRSSIYRTLDLFEKLNIVDRVSLGWKYKFELSGNFTKHHHHLVCSVCGNVTSFQETVIIEQQIKTIANRAHFVPLSHQLEITGICANCTKQ